jgi:tRNA(adenine34) deaminase
MESYEFYMQQAIQKAYEGMKQFEYPFGCCIVCGDKYVATHNTCSSSKNPLQHAEINAIQYMHEHGMLLEEPILVFTTVEPCLMCLGALNWIKISKLFFGLGIETSEKLGFNEVHLNIQDVVHKFPHTVEVYSNFMEQECRELIKTWQSENSVLSWFHKKTKAGE